MKTIFHLSHTDLDGYGCQYITQNYFQNREENIQFYNSGYGKKIDETLKHILKKINKKDTLLITDLNLTGEQAHFISEQSKNKKFELVLIDHHGTGQETADKYKWYNLDTSKSATLLTFEYFYKDIQNFNLRYTAEIINAYDIWLKDTPEFVKGKTLNGIVMDNLNLFPEVFEEQQRLVVFELIKQASFVNAMTSGNVVKTEEVVYPTLRGYLGFGIKNSDELPFSELKAYYLYEHLDDKFEEMTIEGKRVDVFFDMIDVFQEISQLRFKRNNVDIAVHISPSGAISLRASNEEGNDSRVDNLAKHLFSGGGHPKASGGFMHIGELDALSYGDAMDIFYENIKHL